MGFDFSILTTFKARHNVAVIVNVELLSLMFGGFITSDQDRHDHVNVFIPVRVLRWSEALGEALGLHGNNPALMCVYFQYLSKPTEMDLATHQSYFSASEVPFAESSN